MAVGKFITFEGGEGSGKSTQARRLADQLWSVGIHTMVTREPGGSPFAEAMRKVILDPEMPPHSALSEALLFYSARADHLDKTIRPALNEGLWVICDRFSDSTRVYQSEAGGLPGEVIDILDEMVVAPTTPDLTLILDLPAELGLGRALGRRVHGSNPDTEADAYEKRDLAFHWRLREAFTAIARAEPERCVLIDATTGREQRLRRRVAGRAVASPGAGALMARAAATVEIEELPEADRLEGFPHPRADEETVRARGGRARPRRVRSASGRMHHAWLVCGPAGDRQGDARLPVRSCGARASE